MLNMKDRHVWRGRFYNAARLVIAMTRRGFSPKQLQKMTMRLHDLQRALIKRLETITVPYDRVPFYFDGNCEDFSCSSTPVKGSEKRSWDDHLHSLLFRALPCVSHSTHEDLNVSNKIISISEHQEQCACADESPKSAMEDLCSPQVDRRAEEFITAFYEQMRLQRQDSYRQCQEMLARAT